MRNLLFVALAALSCFSAVASQAEDEHGLVQHASEVSKLSLNHGKRWVADRHTNESVKKMLTVIEEFYGKEDARSTKDYGELGKELQGLLGKLIQGCTMEGQEHEQLHLWISRLGPEQDLLAKVTTVSAGKDTAERVNSMLHEYEQFFE